MVGGLGFVGLGLEWWGSRVFGPRLWGGWGVSVFRLGSGARVLGWSHRTPERATKRERERESGIEFSGFRVFVAFGFGSLGARELWWEQDSEIRQMS